MSADDPLTAFLRRSLRIEVTDVRGEMLVKDSDGELERLWFADGDQRRSLLIQRLPPSRSLEVRLLPFLARKSAAVPRVFARGVPPPSVVGWPWLLVEDLLDAPSACDDPVSVVRAKAAVERSVSADGPALRALGLVASPDRPDLAGWPQGLIHGDLRFTSAVRADRGVVLRGWHAASLGPGIVDVIAIAAETGADADALAEAYGSALGVSVQSKLPSRPGGRGDPARPVAEESPDSTGQGSG